VDIKRYCFSFVAVFAFIFLSDYLCHEFLLAEMYEKTRELWRAKDEHIMTCSPKTDPVVKLV
jgi:hypothetical protein